MRKLVLLLCGCIFSIVFTQRSIAQVHIDAKYHPVPPATLGTGYYVIDNSDPVPLPWHPIPNFVDTTYQPYLWHRVLNGPHSFLPTPNPVWYWQSINGDSTNNTFCGPIPLGFEFNFYGNNYDSVYLSSNGYIGFGNWNRAIGNDGPAFSAGGGGFNASSLPSNNVPKAVACFMATDDYILHTKSDSTKVYFKTSLSNDSLFISYYGLYFGNGANGALTSGYLDKYWIDVQICLTYQDSSITFTYKAFHGNITSGLTPYPSGQVFEDGAMGSVSAAYASIIGVQDSTRTQGTTYMGGGNINDITAGSRPNQQGVANSYSLQNGSCVQFKRWRDIATADTIIWPPRNYEMLQGDSLQPIASFGNVAPIAKSFNTVFRIRNLITGQIVYEGEDSVLNLVSLGTIRDTFPTYYTYAGGAFTEQVGTMFAEAMSTGTVGDNNQLIGDEWPFDDTIRQELFVIEQLSAPFYDFNNNFSVPVLLPGTIPNALQWVNINANVVDGEQWTFNPPPPRGLEGDTAFGQLNSPLILMDRKDANGNFYPKCAFGGETPMPPYPSNPPPATYTGYSSPIGQGGVGDTIISFPIDLSATKHALLGMSYERAGKNSYPRWYDLSSAIGPERTVLYPDGVSVARPGDSLTIEYANWTQVTNVSSWFEEWAADGGKDLNFSRVYIPIDSPFTWQYFRFRVRLKAKNDFEPGGPGDDADDWFVDNFVVASPLKPEIEVSFVRVDPQYPYLRIPASQAGSIPIQVGIGNNGGAVANSFGVEIQIWPPPGTVNYTVYDQLLTEQSVAPGTNLLITAPSFNAQVNPQANYQITARLRPANYDAVNENDSTYCLFASQFDSSYVYDTGTNDVPGFFGLAGIGLKLQEQSPDAPVGGSGTAGTGSGTIATKFKMYTRDTIYGVQAYFGSYNQANDPIRLALYSSSGSNTPNQLLALTTGIPCDSTTVYRQGPWDAYSTYLFACAPIILNPGTYWVGVSQLSEGNGMELGGNASRSSVDWIGYDPSAQAQEVFVINYPGIDTAFAYENTALSNTWYPFYYPGGVGVPAFSYAINSPAGANAPASVVASIDCGKDYNYFFGEGSWIPMIRPFFKWRTPSNVFVADPPKLPIELLSFTGAYSNNLVALSWKTASEINNSGFNVQRRMLGENDWAQINNQLIPGFGTTASEHEYSYNDPNVAVGTIYQYRLQQQDNDGTVSYSNVIEITTPATDYMLSANYPNPFNATTQISFALPKSGLVTLKVYDMAGHEVKTLVNATEQATSPVSVTWDGTNEAGSPVSSGTYLYKMEVNGQILSHKLSLTR